VRISQLGLNYRAKDSRFHRFMSSVAFKAEADRKLAFLAGKQAEFTALGPGDKVQLLGELLTSLAATEEALRTMADAAVLAEGYESVEDKNADVAWCLEQVLMAQWVSGFCQRFKANLESVAKVGRCKQPKKVTTRADGQKVAEVFPLDGADGMKPQKDWKAELWIQKGKDATQGAMFGQSPRPESVALVLGAGNVGALAVSDCLHVLFQHNSVVLFKLHPVRTYQESFVRKLFAPLIAKGYFETIKEESGLPDAQYLVKQPLLCHIHMTGSTETHDAIVWGPREGRDERRATKQGSVDLTKVTVTSELGCITPYMVCPGNWKPEELQHHALQLACASTGNNGYYCNSPKLLVLAEGWPQKEAFLGILRAILKGLPAMPPYYPGSHKRYEGFEAAYKQGIEKIEGPGFGTSQKWGAHIPWSLVHISVDPSNLEASKGEYAFQNEPFCPVLTVCTLKGVSEPQQYLEVSTALVNRIVWGRLSCSLVVHPETQKAAPAAVDKAIASLEYGNITINAWSALSYSIDTGVWGAYAGGSPPLERLECVESGLGFVNNTLAFDHIEKCVVITPFIDKTNHTGTGPKLTREGGTNLTNLLINPGLKNLMKLLAPGLFKPKAQAAFACVGAVAIGLCAMAHFSA